MLDLVVSIRAGHISAIPCMDKQPLPLCVSSLHHTHVHRSWPAAVRRRALALAGPHHSTAVLSQLLNNYRGVATHPDTLQRLAGSQPRQHNNNDNDPRPRFAFVLRYHPTLVKSFVIASRRAPIPRSLEFKLIPAWANGVPSVSSVTLKHNDKILEDQWAAERQCMPAEGWSSLLSSCNNSLIELSEVS